MNRRGFIKTVTGAVAGIYAAFLKTGRTNRATAQFTSLLTRRCETILEEEKTRVSTIHLKDGTVTFLNLENRLIRELNKMRVTSESGAHIRLRKSDFYKAVGKRNTNFGFEECTNKPLFFGIDVVFGEGWPQVCRPLGYNQMIVMWV